MKILHTGDWHFASKNPVSRTDDYNEEIFASLDNLRVLAVTFRVGAVCIAGDLFHDTRTPMSVIIRLLTWAGQLREICPIFCIRGNHDLRHDRFESIERLPYGILLASGLFQDVSRQLVSLGDGRMLYGVPWPDGASIEGYAGIPPQADLVLAHGWATPTGDMRWGNWCARYDELTTRAPNAKVWHFGHDHSDNGVYQCTNGAHMVNIGALSRGALDRDTLVRDVKVAVSEWHPDGRVTVQQIRMPVPPASEIFDLQKRQQQAAERQALERFVAQFGQNLTGMVTVRYEDVLAQTTLDAAVRAKIDTYLQAAEGD